MNSLVDKSAGILFFSCVEKPNITFIQDLKKKVGANKYKKNIKKNAANGNKSRKNEKNNISETKKIEPGKPKNISILSSVTRNSLGHKKFNPPTSDISLVLKRRAMASTSKKEFVEINA